MSDRLVIEKHYTDNRVTVAGATRCTIYPAAFNEEGLESIHIESIDDSILKAYKCYLNYNFGVRGASLSPKKIIFNGPATIVMWTDGTKTVVKQSKLDNYDYEKGFAMCVVKKVFGDRYNAIRKMVDESYENTLTQITDEVCECFFAKLFGKGE